MADGVGDVMIGDEVYALTSFCLMGVLRSMSRFAPVTFRQNQRRLITRRRPLFRFPR
jgi:hypothetical protein